MSSFVIIASLHRSTSPDLSSHLFLGAWALFTRFARRIETYWERTDYSIPGLRNKLQYQWDSSTSLSCRAYQVIYWGQMAPAI